jgi:hypothetical protein
VSDAQREGSNEYGVREDGDEGESGEPEEYVEQKSSRVRAPKRGGCTTASQAFRAHGKRQQREHVRQSEKELIGQGESHRLEDVLQGDYSAEEECGNDRTSGVPSPQSDDGNGDESASGGHPFGKGSRVSEHERCTAEAGQCAAEKNGEPSHPRGAYARSACGIRLLADRT